MSLTEQEKKEALRYAINGADFMFIPSVKLMETVARGEHPYVQSLPHVFSYTLLRKLPIKIKNDMVVKYCLGTLDNKNTWILEQGDIKVTPHKFNLDKGT